MRKTLVATALALGLSFGAFTATASAAPPSCNWGTLTAEEIADGFDQGGHASDPNMDGRGPENRVGLANVVEKGNLEATCDLIRSLP